MSPLLLAALAGLGLALVVVGQRLMRVQTDPVAERLAQLKADLRTLEQIELQQPFSERVVRPFVRQIANALNRFQRRTTRQERAPEVGLEGIRRKLALAGNPFQWTPADYLGTKGLAAVGFATMLFF